MVAIVENVNRLGRRSGVLSATAGLVNAYLILVISDMRSEEDLISDVLLSFLYWDTGLIWSAGLGAVIVLSTAYLTGAFIGRMALKSFSRVYVWSILVAYLDLVLGLAAMYAIDCFIQSQVAPSVLQLSELSPWTLLVFSSIYAALPIVVVALTRAFFLRHKFKPGKVLW